MLAESAHSPAPQTFAPGARVEIRDEEWIVRSVKSATFGGLAVHVVGTSELVRNKEAVFLSELDTIRELKPEETQLVHDSSPHYRQSRLYIESLLRKSPPTDDGIYLGHRAAIRPTNYQLQPAAKALSQPRQRILMADGVGLGKTIEVGVLLTELIERGRGDRILVVALKSILAQFQEELWARFTIPLVRLDSVGLQRVQSRIPSNMNPFYYYDRVIISVDTLKRDEKYRRYLEDSRWDAIVVDECQHIAVRTKTGGGRKSQRARLGQLLARKCDALILTSATPHDGRPQSFASLMNLLESTAVADESNYTSDEISDLFLRRFKKDISHEIEDAFRERKIGLEKTPASKAEDRVFEILDSIEFKTIARERNNKGVLFRTLLLKAFLSSPAACSSTVGKRLEHKALQGDDPEAAHDRLVLSDLKSAVDAVGARHLGKLQKLIDGLRKLGLDKPICTERVVIFSERIDTLHFLEEELKKTLGLKGDEVEVFHGTLDDQKQKDLVKSFGSESSPIKVLLASDVASEGLNLHYFCHRMIHFDLPWSLITLEQRNGRIDRFGQKRTPLISYLLTIPSDPKIQGDLRVLERLIEKEDNAHKNLGDVAWLLDLHNAEKEEEHIGKGLEEGKTAEEIIPEEEQHTDFMKMLFGEDTPKDPPAEIKLRTRLYEDELVYAREAFAEILGDDSRVDWHDHLAGFTIHPPEDLERRFDYLPLELRKNGLSAKLTTDRQLVMKAIDEARQDEDRWPEWQLFWEQHPIAEWLDDRVLAAFGRHEAPVLRVQQGLSPGERVLLFQGIISNRRSQPAVVDWFGVFFRDGSQGTVEPFSDLALRTRLTAQLSNPSGAISAVALGELTGLLPTAVARGREHMTALRESRAEALSQPFRESAAKLARWKAKSLDRVEQLQLSFLKNRNKLRSDQKRRLSDQRQEIDRLHKDQATWIESLRTVKEPYLRVVAALVPLDS